MRTHDDHDMTDSSYEAIADFGVLYDAVPAYATRGDVAFYVGEAARNGAASSATILELGCGTGRVLLPLARSGHTITGLDRSPAMLSRCRAKLAAEPDAVQDRVALYQGDVRDFSVDPPASGGFSLVIAPFRVMQHLTTIPDQLRCLSAIHRHLAPGGRFVLDVFNPNFGLMARDRSAEVEDTAEFRLSDGRHLRRTSRVTGVQWIDQVSDIELIYYVRTGEHVERIVQAFSMRWYTRPELEHLLERAGFRVDAMYGDFDRNPLRDESREIVVVGIRC